MSYLKDTFNRWQLERKGLSSGKKRKQFEEDTFVHNLDDSITLRASVFLAFITGTLLITYQMSRYGFYKDGLNIKLVEMFFLVIALFAVFLLNHRDKIPKTRLLFLIFGGMLLQTSLCCLAIVLIGSSTSAPGYLVLVTPYTFVPMILSVLLGRWVGIFAAVYMGLFASVLSPTHLGTEVMIVAICSSLTGVYFTQNLKKRNQLLHAGFYAGLVALLASWSLQIIPIHTSDGFLNSKNALTQSGILLLTHFFTGLIVGGIMPGLETLFQVTTNMTWLELTDLNHKLLRRMQLEAPGTFHHSMVVATLSEAAAESIGANAPLCRVASYFHDIGKVEKPEYFIENQGDENPHDNLTPNMSALVIIAHVKDGVDLAVRHKLNDAIINVIQEHHGNSLVYYFYCKAQENRKKALNINLDEGRPEVSCPAVSEKGFRYPGPIPKTKESGIIALADSVESASRSIKKATPLKIQTMIDEIVNNKIKNGILDDCPLTIKELNKIKSVFAKTLRSMLHSRIDYPKEGETKRDDLQKSLVKADKTVQDAVLESPRLLNDMSKKKK